MCRILVIAVAVAQSVAGCLASPVSQDRPARIVDANPASRAALQQAVSEALHVAEVLLADDALTRSSWLIIERQRIRNLQNAPLPGRDPGRPERFQLMLNGERCILVHESSRRRFELPETDCVAE